MSRTLVALALSLPALAHAYPTDEAAEAHSGIKRLHWQRDVDAGKMRGTKTPRGARRSLAGIELRMLEAADFDLSADTPKDPVLQAGLEAILARERWKAYNVALLDITDPESPRWAAVNETAPQTPGSVAKLLVAAAMFEALRQRFPEDTEARLRLLREVRVPADDWLMPNSHEVPIVIGDLAGQYQVIQRKVKHKDTFTLFEWLDHALSPSSNAAGSLIWREAVLMRLLGETYPPAKWDDALWRRWDRPSFSAAAFSAVDAPLTAAGLSVEDFYLRLFFTTEAGRWVESGPSRASPLGLLRYWLRVEQGRMVDRFSSLELKRLLYVTRRRIRYAVAPELADAAVYFKSGSLFECVPEEGFSCSQYRGNAVNVLNAIVEVESETLPPLEAVPPDFVGPPEPLLRVYAVAVMSNELKRNAAADHMRLAGEIHRLVLDN